MLAKYYHHDRCCVIGKASFGPAALGALFELGFDTLPVLIHDAGGCVLAVNRRSTYRFASTGWELMLV